MKQLLINAGEAMTSVVQNAETTSHAFNKGWNKGWNKWGK